MKRACLFLSLFAPVALFAWSSCSSSSTPSSAKDAGSFPDAPPVDGATDTAPPPALDAGAIEAAPGADAASVFSGVPATITFSPPAIVLDNPTTASGTTAPQSATFSLTVTELDGGVVTPSPSSPVTVNVYGPGVVSPASVTVTSGAPVTLTYDGQYFAAPMAVTASAALASGAAVGTAELVPANAACNLGTSSAKLPLRCAATECTGAAVVESGLFVEASVGGGPTGRFQLDTGSLGLVVPASELGPAKIGPGPAGMKFYDSDGYEFIGNYYLVPVTFTDDSGAPWTTVPILVLGTTSTACHAGYPSCVPPANTVHVIGVGFDRNASAASDLFSGPAANPFLALEAEAKGTMTPGYALSAGSDAIGYDAVVGVTSALRAGFSTYALSPNAAVPGDWHAAAGCFGFPALSPTTFCGDMLVDVGLGGMFLELPTAQRPAAIASANPPSGTMMTIAAPNPAGAALSYSFTYVTSATPSPGVAPTTIAWSGSSATFVNTGRHLLSQFDYLFDATCGNVGYAPSNAGTH